MRQHSFFNRFWCPFFWGCRSFFTNESWILNVNLRIQVRRGKFEVLCCLNLLNAFNDYISISCHPAQFLLPISDGFCQFPTDFLGSVALNPFFQVLSVKAKPQWAFNSWFWFRMEQEKEERSPSINVAFSEMNMARSTGRWILRSQRIMTYHIC